MRPRQQLAVSTKMHIALRKIS